MRVRLQGFVCYFAEMAEECQWTTEVSYLLSRYASSARYQQVELELDVCSLTALIHPVPALRVVSVPIRDMTGTVKSMKALKKVRLSAKGS